MTRKSSPGKEREMKRTFLFLVLASALLITACGEEVTGNKVVVTKVEGYKATLPPVPTIPPPSAPETYSDGSYSVYGLRRNESKTMDSEVEVTAYIAKIYEKPVCPEGKTCHTMMPHLYLADEKDETISKRYLRLVGYAQNFQEMEDARADAEAGKEPEPLPEGVYLPPVVWDWRLGHKYKIKGSFVNRSGAGFMDADGLMEYREHQCLDCPVEEEEEKK